MKKLSFKIASLLLAFTVLFSTLSFSVNRHYCGELLFSQSFFNHSLDCGMETMDFSNTDNPFSDSMKSDGCHNIQLLIKGQNVEQKALISNSLELHKIALILDFDILPFEESIQKNLPFYKNYSPPLLVKNISVLVQTFRI
ncbi:MAG: hypothetical protein QM486_10625 [Flavobacteriaceae bacterium]